MTVDQATGVQMTICSIASWIIYRRKRAGANG